MARPSHDSLQHFLDRLFERYHRRDYLASDPLEFVHQYTDPWDQEAVALLSAVLAYGNVTQIKKSVSNALARMAHVSGSPSAFVRSYQGKPVSGTFDGWVHRFNRGEDLDTLFWLLAQSWKKHGSLGAHFLTHHVPGAETIEPALAAFIAEWRAWALTSPAGKPPVFLLTAPTDGSACKRWCMFLRWMGRDDSHATEVLDPGLWCAGSQLAHTFPEGRALHASQLVIPLDTHTGRITRYIGLTQRKTMDWKAAVEVTRSLRKCHAEDPTRYDFAIARLGILDLCQRKYRAEICVSCDLKMVCHFALRGQKKSQKPSSQLSPRPRSRNARS